MPRAVEAEHGHKHVSTQHALAARLDNAFTSSETATITGPVARPVAFEVRGTTLVFRGTSFASLSANREALHPSQTAAQAPQSTPPATPILVVQPIGTAAGAPAVPAVAPNADATTAAGGLQALPDTAAHEPPDAVAASRHVFLERTRDGAVIWLRDAQADPQTLARSVRTLVDEAHRRGVRVAGVRWNGQPLAVDLNHFRPEHQQGEDRGR